MQTGELDRRIALESPVKTANTYGEQVLTWATYKTVWAKAVWDGGMEKEESDKLTATTKVVFTVRNIDNVVDVEYRVLYDSKYYYIKVIRQIDGREMFLELETELKD